MKKSIIFLAILPMVIGLFAFSFWQNDDDHLYVKNNVAVSGYDAVAYFTEEKAVKGSEAMSLEWGGATWLFSSEKNRDLFQKNPKLYAPQYGGYCAYGASNGYKAPTDPEAWTIVGGKLYLNYSKKVKETWLPDTAARIISADRYWQSLTKQ
ncbi:MAG: YHS domain-containing protein [Chitinophagaceae bacterium]|nr:YHS domain-containing protein [Chitinophagaceae bacterium]